MPQHKPLRENDKHPVRLLLLLLLSILVIFAIYQVFVVRLGQLWLFWVYYVLTAVTAIAYIGYNFGLSRQNVTPDMLPLEWTATEKMAYLEEARLRKKKSRFLLIILLGLIFTLAFDMAVLFYPELFGGLQEAINSWFF